MYAAKQPLDSSNDPVFCCSTYNSHGNRGCNRNIIHQAQLMPFLVEKIQELILAPKNVERLRTKVKQQLSQQSTEHAPNTKALRSRLAALDKDIKAAAAELKRTPDDLYTLAVDDLRELRTKRDRLTAELEALEATVPRPKGDIGKRTDQAIAAIQWLGEGLASADPARVREVLNQIVERIELWFDHEKSAKLTKSYFRKGVIHFRKPTSLLARANRLR
jgi:chromosome segregation ATPase